MKKQKGKKSSSPLLKTSGKISIHPRGFGFVTPCDELDFDIFIPKRFIKDAFDGDQVEISYLYDPVTDRADGKILKVLKRAKSSYGGVITEKRGSKYLVTLLLPGLRDQLFIQSRQKLAIGTRVLVEVLHFGKRLEDRKGNLLEVLGSIKDPKIDVIAAIKENNLPDSFPKQVETEASSFGETVLEKDCKDRRDLRDLTCITIDPTTAKDFDDALSLQKDKKGYLLGVHIADVSHYVKPHSALDKEAYKRANSTYLPGMVIPMLPHALSSHLCSLKPHVDRLAVTVMARLDLQGKIVSYEIFRSVIQSKKRFTYQEAKRVLDGKEKSPYLPLLKDLIDLMKALKKQRYLRGSIEFALPDIELILDDQGAPQKIELVEYDETHQLVEECMLKANEVVATALFKQGRDLTYRIHDQPDPSQIAEFAGLARLFGFNLPSDPTNEELQVFFDEVRESAYGKFLATSFIKSMKIASYSTQNIGHYGLCLEHYTHFTSPIRRYIDLVVHRTLLDNKSSKIPLDEIAKHCSEKERKSAQIENKVVYLKKIRLLQTMLKKDPKITFEALVLTKKNFGVSFELPNLLFEGVLLKEDLSFKAFEKMVAGEKIKVKVKDIDLIAQKVTWSLL